MERLQLQLYSILLEVQFGINPPAYYATPMLLDRIKYKFKGLDDSECWVWRGATSSNGQPAASYNGKYTPIRRGIAQEIYNLGSTDFVLSSCNNKLCVNPSHIKIISAEDYHRSLRVKKARKVRTPKVYDWCKEFNLRINKEGPLSPYVEGNCIEWTGSLDKAGYGAFCYHGSPTKAHRISLVFGINGDVHSCLPPPWLVARHQCHNKKCVNPAHLIFGSLGDNCRDTVAAGRGNHRKGGRHGQAKLSDQAASVVKAMIIMYVYPKYVNAYLSTVGMSCSPKYLKEFRTSRGGWKHLKKATLSEKFIKNFSNRSPDAQLQVFEEFVILCNKAHLKILK